AKYDPSSKRWDQVGGQVANDLVSVPALHLPAWLESLRPVREKLQAPLAGVYRDSKRRETERSLATDLLADYAAGRPAVLAALLLDADEKQFAVLYPKLKERGERGLPLLLAEIDRTLPADLPSSDPQREWLAKRQANAVVALLRMNQPAKVWPLLKHSPDPRVRSYLIHRFGPLGADPQPIPARLPHQADVSVRRALLLCLGEFGEAAWPPGGRDVLVRNLREFYRTAADPGLRAAAEWLLRQWQEEAWLAQTDEAWARGKEMR